MSWDTPTRGNEENTSKFTRGKKTIEGCIENDVFLVAVTEHSATPSLDTGPWEHDPAKGSLVPENELEETIFKMLEPFSEDVVDDDAAPVRNFPSDETDAGSNPLCGNISLGCHRCGRRSSR